MDRRVRRIMTVILGLPIWLWVVLFGITVIAYRLRQIARNTKRPLTREELQEQAAWRRMKKYGDGGDPWSDQNDDDATRHGT